MKLSLIIPVYNVEKYISKCLSSCLNQNILSTDYEIIVVNDGSPDNSLNIINSFVLKYDNIRVVTQENQGLSVARNNGLNVSKGEYVWFIDSDDSIEENCLAEICAKLSTGIDMLQIQYRYTYDSENLNTDAKIIKIDSVISGKQQILNGGIFIPAPFTIYRKDFLLENNLKFYPNIYHEDLEFKPRALYLAKTICSYNKIVYNYYQRSSGSITSNFRIKHGKDLFQVGKNLYHFVLQHNIRGNYKRYFYQCIGIALNMLLNGLINLNDSDKTILLKELSKNKLLISKMFLALKFKYVLESVLLLIHPKLGFFVYRNMKKRQR